MLTWDDKFKTLCSMTSEILAALIVSEKDGAVDSEDIQLAKDLALEIYKDTLKVMSETNET